jgi:hypothetical protein
MSTFQRRVIRKVKSRNPDLGNDVNSIRQYIWSVLNGAGVVVALSADDLFERFDRLTKFADKTSPMVLDSDDNDDPIADDNEVQPLDHDPVITELVARSQRNVENAVALPRMRPVHKMHPFVSATSRWSDAGDHVFKQFKSSINNTR